MSKDMNPRNRASLKRNFSKGRLLSESDFAELIDSTVNKIDDGFSKDEKHGFQLSPSIGSNRVLSIFHHFTDRDPYWYMSLERESEESTLCIHGPDRNSKQKKFLGFHENGHIGVNTRKPGYDFEVNGFAGMKGRIGTFANGIKDGNGSWHTLLSLEENSPGGPSCPMNAFEVVAFISGRDAQFAGLYAMAMRVFRKGKIRKVRCNTGWFFNRLSLRWKRMKVGGQQLENHWLLQIRTMRPYSKLADGQYPKIRYHITQLSDGML